MVVPYRIEAARFVARAGWKVFTDLFACVTDLEMEITGSERHRNEYDCRRAREKPTRGSSTAGNATQKTIFKKELPPSEETIERVRWVHVDPVNKLEHTLLEDIRGWKRLTLEDYNAWLVQWRMMGKQFRWVFEDRWLPLFPLCDSPPKPRMMGFRGSHEVHASTAATGRDAPRAGGRERGHEDRHRKG